MNKFSSEYTRNNIRKQKSNAMILTVILKQLRDIYHSGYDTSLTDSLRTPTDYRFATTSQPPS